MFTYVHMTSTWQWTSASVSFGFANVLRWLRGPGRSRRRGAEVCVLGGGQLAGAVASRKGAQVGGPQHLSGLGGGERLNNVEPKQKKSWTLLLKRVRSILLFVFFILPFFPMSLFFSPSFRYRRRKRSNGSGSDVGPRPRLSADPFASIDRCSLANGEFWCKSLIFQLFATVFTLLIHS